MTFLKDLASEAKELRAQLDRLNAEGERLEATLSVLEEEAVTYAVAPGSFVSSQSEQARGTEISAERGAIQDRLRSIVDERSEAERRLRIVLGRLEAGPRADQARAELRERREQIVVASRRSDAQAAAVEKLLSMQRAHTQQLAVNLQGQAAALLAEVGAESDDASPPTDHRQAVDAAAHAHAGLAIERALQDARAKQEQLDQELNDARDAARAAQSELATQIAAVAELRHAEALSTYLPALAEYLAAHRVAHDWSPAAPDVGRLAREGLEPATAAVHALLSQDPDAGVMSKAAKAVRGLLS